MVMFNDLIVVHNINIIVKTAFINYGVNGGYMDIADNYSLAYFKLGLWARLS